MPHIETYECDACKIQGGEQRGWGGYVVPQGWFTLYQRVAAFLDGNDEDEEDQRVNPARYFCSALCLSNFALEEAKNE